MGLCGSGVENRKSPFWLPQLRSGPPSGAPSRRSWRRSARTGSRWSAAGASERETPAEKETSSAPARLLSPCVLRRGQPPACQASLSAGLPARGRARAAAVFPSRLQHALESCRLLVATIVYGSKKSQAGARSTSSATQIRRAARAAPAAPAFPLFPCMWHVGTGDTEAATSSMRGLIGP